MVIMLLLSVVGNAVHNNNNYYIYGFDGFMVDKTNEPPKPLFDYKARKA
jgi:hypothetical protein